MVEYENKICGMKQKVRHLLESNIHEVTEKCENLNEILSFKFELPEIKQLRSKIKINE